MLSVSSALIAAGECDGSACAVTGIRQNHDGDYSNNASSSVFFLTSSSRLNQVSMSSATARRTEILFGVDCRRVPAPTALSALAGVWHYIAMSTAEERPDKSSQHHSEQYSGLYRGSEAYRTAAAADYRSVLTTGIVVLDSSVLLNLYRYSANTRRDLFGVLNELHDQLWVPHQVIAEFWKNREKILQDPRDTIRTLSELSSLRDQAIQCVRLLATRVEMTGRNAEHLVQSLAAGFDPVTDAAEDLVEQEKALRAYIEDTKVDPVPY